MKPTIEILISSPVTGSEAVALQEIVLAVRPPALILVNFEVPRSNCRQIDFVVITNQRTELIELKSFTAPVKGGVNGSWQLETSPGFFEQYAGANPWEQARDAKFALSDAMHDFTKSRLGVPPPRRKYFYEQFDASVTVYPRIMPGSQLWSGNFKVWIRSFSDTLHDLNSRPLPTQTTWDFHNWRVFATDYLGLKPATLASAIDVQVFEADQWINEFITRIRHSVIAPLLPSQEHECMGENVMAKLAGPGDRLLLGASGLGKSFHLDHYRRCCFEFDEVPILLNAGHYRGDLNRAIHKSIGQYTRLKPVELLDSIKRLGKHPVLLVDAWNNCSASLQRDLGDDLSAFQLNYNTRLITAVQAVPPHSVFAAAVQVELSTLRLEHKQAIFAFHAGDQAEKTSSYCYEPFSTAFDLSIAGRSQRDGLVAETRAEVYDSYVRFTVPSASARAVLRKLAWHMGEEFKSVLLAAEYERAVEKIAQQCGISLSVVDELLQSRILITENGFVRFEHDLLKDYFRAQHLIWEGDSQYLREKLQEPKYSGLAEFILPSIKDDLILQDLLTVITPDLSSKAFRGWLGSPAKELVRHQCKIFFQQCFDKLPEITVEAAIETLDNKLVVFTACVVGPSCCSELDRHLCAVVADNLDDPILQQDFLTLLDLGEWALKKACAQTGGKLRIKANAIWRQLLHGNVICRQDGPEHPLLLISHQIRESFDGFTQHAKQLPIRDALLQRVHTDKAGALALLLLLNLHYAQSNDWVNILAVARQAWNTELVAIQSEALNFLHAHAHLICSAGTEAEVAVIALMDEMNVSSNLLLSTQWVDARSCFSGFDTGLHSDDALKEFNRIIVAARGEDKALYRLEHKIDPTLTFEQFLARWANAELGKIFEQPFQDAYFEAYEQLSADDKKCLLVWALRHARVGWLTTWYMQQLLKLGYADVTDVFLRHGSRIESEVLVAHEGVAAFVTANMAYSQFSDEPISYREVESSDHRTWAIIGELLFWTDRRNDTRCSARTAALYNELIYVAAALPDVLRQLRHQFIPGLGIAPVLEQLLNHQPESIRKTLHKSLEYEGRLTSAFRGEQFFQEENFRMIISTLGDIGNAETVVLLRPFTKHPKYAKAAIQSLEKIGRNVVASTGDSYV